ncbi:MAG: hypothetical protein PUI78_01805 [Treponema sp.]|nr:hypothetical protein [Treponema sp.]
MKKEEIKQKLKDGFNLNAGSPIEKSNFFSVLITFIFALLCLIFFAFYKVDVKPRYKTVKINLSPVSQVVPEKSQKKEEKIPQKKEVQKVQKENIQKTQPKKTEQISKNALKAQEQKQASLPQKKSSKPSSAAKKSEPSSKTYTYKKSLEELMEEQFASSVSNDSEWKEDFTEDAFDDFEQNFSSENALQGTAGTLETSSSVKSVSENAQVSSQTVSETTGAMLSQISQATYSSDISSSVKTSQSIFAKKTSSGEVSLKLNDGSVRVLLDPKEPSIKISQEASQTIDSSRNVVIQFKILPDGSVPRNGISFIPGSALTDAVKREVENQVSKWIFAKASSEGFAKFEYNIIRK